MREQVIYKAVIPTREQLTEAAKHLMTEQAPVTLSVSIAQPVRCICCGGPAHETELH